MWSRLRSATEGDLAAEQRTRMRAARHTRWRSVLRGNANEFRTAFPDEIEDGDLECGIVHNLNTLVDEKDARLA